MTRDELISMVRNAGVACQCRAEMVDVDERMGGVLVRVAGTEEDAASVIAWLTKCGPMGITWRANVAREES